MEILQSDAFMGYWFACTLVYPFIGDKSMNFICRYIKGLFIAPIAVPFILIMRKIG